MTEFPLSDNFELYEGWPSDEEIEKDRIVEEKKVSEKAPNHPEWLPENWKIELKVRTSGKSAGAKDRYYFSPDGRKYRSKNEVMKALTQEIPPKKRKEAPPKKKQETPKKKQEKPKKRQKTKPLSKPKKTSQSSCFIDFYGKSIPLTTFGSGSIPCVIVGLSNHIFRGVSLNLFHHFKFIICDLYWTDETFELNYSQMTMDTLVDDLEILRSLLVEKKIIDQDEKIALFGFSAFGLLSLAYTLKYPSKISYLILITTPPCMSDEQEKIIKDYYAHHASRERKEAYRLSLAKINHRIEIEKPNPTQEFIMRYLSNAPLTWKDLKFSGQFLWEGITLNIKLIKEIYLGKILKNFDLSNSYSDISTPIFLALGRFDYLVPCTSWDKKVKDFKDAKLHLFEHSGHWPNLEQQREFDQALVSWIQEKQKKSKETQVVSLVVE